MTAPRRIGRGVIFGYNETFLASKAADPKILHMDPATIFAGISAFKDALDLAQEYKKEREKMGPGRPVQKSFGGGGRRPLFESYGSRAEKNETRDAAQSLQIIDSDLLETMKRNIEHAKARLNSALGDPSNNNQAKDEEMRVASASICAELKRILTLNGGKGFPAQLFDELWVSFGCAPKIIGKAR